jgi:hypothetical protein
VVSFKGGFNRYVEEYIGQNAGFKPSLLGMPTFLDSACGPPSFPSITVAGMQALGAGGGLTKNPRGNAYLFG